MSNKKHLTLDERITIQTLLDIGKSPTDIARQLERYPSTITRELQNHIHIEKSNNDCVLYVACKEKWKCGTRFCTNKCKDCTKNCHKYCSHYEKAECNIMQKTNYVCNGCPKKASCRLERHFYNALSADKEYQEMLVEKRSGFDLSEDDLIKIDEVVTPLIKAGHSPYAVLNETNGKIPVSLSTLYRLIDKSQLTARNIDLQEQVKRKRRHHSNKDAITKPVKNKEGHLYKDYLEYAEEHGAVPQMDCVEGTQEDSKVFLTLHWPIEHMQLYFIMSKQTTNEVVKTLDKIEEAIGTELFREMFPAILTDNGHEFADIEGMERSFFNPDEKRTFIYFCEPNRSDQKGNAERNHRLLRKVVPKGTSLESFDQSTATLITNHVNSYIRCSLGGISPYDIAMENYDDDFFVLLGLERIKNVEVNLTPKLIKRIA